MPYQFLTDTRKETLENLPAAQEKEMDMLVLRRSVPWHGAWRIGVALEHDDLFKVSGQHPSCQEPGEASPEDEGASTMCV